MIQEFSVQNFLSFRDKQTISFVATKDKHLLDELTCETKPGGVQLMRLAMIYGANASGKSNLLLAIQTVWQLLFTPMQVEHEEIHSYQPFELTNDQPTQFEITFWANGRRYQYELAYNNNDILYEKLMYTSDNDVLSLMYERAEGGPIRFGSTLGIKAKQRDELSLETLKNHTILSTLNKKNIDVPVPLRELYEWIKNNVHKLGVYSDIEKIAKQAESNPRLKKVILDLLKKADFNIADFSIIKGSILEKSIELLREKGVSESDINKFFFDFKQIFFTHTTGNKKFQLRFERESKGTKAYFRLARLLFDLGKGGYIAMEDELDDSLHYDLLLHFLETYLHTQCQSQFIFTTHNQLLLDEDWLIRRDMIWITEKERETSATTLYRVSDMGIHKNVSLRNAYRIGKLGGKPLLGSTFVNFEEE